MVAGSVGLAAIGVGCGGQRDRTAVGATKVVAAFYPIAFAARQIAGPGTEVVNLTAAGVEPHDLELTPGQARAVIDADVVLYLGGGFQPALEEAVRGRSLPTIDLLGTGGAPLHARGQGEAGKVTDPHVWLDPLRYAAISRRIGAALGQVEKGEELAARLLALDAELAAGLRDCSRRSFVTAHGAFGYLAARYGLEEVPLAGLAPEAEPSPRALARLVRLVEEIGVSTVFSEPLVSADLARTVAREAGVGIATLDPIEGLSSDAAAAGADYFTVMRDNLAALRPALRCA
jgi:zinc transport system substrate-binding protein